MMKLRNKTLLITGGTGSFGTAVLHRFLKTDHFSEIRIFSRDEKKQDDMRNLYKNDKIKYYIGDVRDYSSVEPATRGVDYIFHAAALKQVPSCEFFPMQAVKTNVEGTSRQTDKDKARFINMAFSSAIETINFLILSNDLGFLSDEHYVVLREKIEKITNQLNSLYDRYEK